jgi:hypothetical protein
MCGNGLVRNEVEFGLVPEREWGIGGMTV